MNLIQCLGLSFLSVWMGCNTLPTKTCHAIEFLANQKPVRFEVSVAKTQSEREKGLMGVTSLGAREGMLFIFDHPVTYAFWMKNTPLSLDMIFLDKQFSVVDVISRTTPNSTQLYKPRSPYTYTLEIAAGLADANQIRIGTQGHYHALCH